MEKIQGGCKKGGKCKYAHEHCKSQKEFDDLLVKVTAGSGSSGDERKKGKATAVASKPELRKFKKEFCYFGASCKGIKDGICKLDHKTYPDKESWKAAAMKRDTSLRAAIVSHPNLSDTR